MDNELISTNNNEIKNLIYVIRGKQVMLDSDVARLYQYPTKRINEIVRRNIARFPTEFCFQLSDNEFLNLRSQFATSSLEKNMVEEDICRMYLQNKELQYSLIIDIIKTAKEKIVIIDNYIDESLLSMLSKKKKDIEVIIITTDKCKITELDIKKFNSEYPYLQVIKSNKFHDRFIIIDNKILYHCGASIKDLGKKCFGINRFEDNKITRQIIRKFCLKC